MLNRKILGGLISVLVAANLSANEPKQIDYEFEMIQKTIPKTKIVKYKKSILDGFYNVYFENGNMVYVNPFKNLILFGEILTSTGNSISATEREQWKKELADGGNIVDPQERVISELKKIKNWTLEEKKQLKIIAEKNKQISYIMKDGDVASFYSSLE